MAEQATGSEAGSREKTRYWTRLAWICLALLTSVPLVLGAVELARERVDGVIFGLRCGG